MRSFSAATAWRRRCAAACRAQGRRQSPAAPCSGDAGSSAWTAAGCSSNEGRACNSRHQRPAIPRWQLDRHRPEHHHAGQHLMQLRPKFGRQTLGLFVMGQRRTAAPRLQVRPASRPVPAQRAPNRATAAGRTIARRHPPARNRLALTVTHLVRESAVLAVCRTAGQSSAPRKSARSGTSAAGRPATVTGITLRLPVRSRRGLRWLPRRSTAPVGLRAQQPAQGLAPGSTCRRQHGNGGGTVRVLVDDLLAVRQPASGVLGLAALDVERHGLCIAGHVFELVDRRLSCIRASPRYRRHSARRVPLYVRRTCRDNPLAASQ